MTPKPTDSKRLDSPAGDRAGIAAPAQQWAARLARLDLDAESLEMIMAALTADACEDMNPAPGA